MALLSKLARCALVTGLLASTALAGEEPKQIEAPAETGGWTFSSDFDAAYAFATGKLGGRNVDEHQTRVQYVLISRYKEGPPLRFGAAYQRFSFSSTAGTRFPNTVQSVALVAGIDLQVFEDYFIRLEAQPGFYSGSSRILSDSFNVPVFFGISWLLSKDFQLILGGQYDPQRDFPIVGGLGFRWQITDKLLLNVVPPRPRISYAVSDKLSVYLGAEITGGTYRVDSDFGRREGSRLGRERLDNAWVNFTEIRTGAGATVKAAENLTLEFEAGYLPYRSFDYRAADVEVHQDSGGFYGGVSLSAKF